MRLHQLGKRLGFHDNKALFGQFMEKLSALLDQVDYRGRAHTQIQLGKYWVWLTVSKAKK